MITNPTRIASECTILSTIPDKTTWESFPHHVHFPTQKTISKTTPLRKENPFPQFNVASHKRRGIRLSFEYTTTLLSGEGEREEPVQLWCLEKCCPSIEFSQRTKLLEKVSPIMSTFLRKKLFPKRRLCGKKTPSPNSMLLPINAEGSGFLLNTQQHCFQGKGRGKNRYSYDV